MLHRICFCIEIQLGVNGVLFAHGSKNGKDLKFRSNKLRDFTFLKTTFLCHKSITTVA